MKQKTLSNLILVSYALMMIVSLISAVDLFTISHPTLIFGWMMSIAIEISIAALLMVNRGKVPVKSALYVLGFITLFQICANTYSAYIHITDIKPFAELFAIDEWEIIDQKRVLAFATGGLLPAICLSLIYIQNEVRMKTEQEEETEQEPDQETDQEQPTEEIPEEEEDTPVSEQEDPIVETEDAPEEETMVVPGKTYEFSHNWNDENEADADPQEEPQTVAETVEEKVEEPIVKVPKKKTAKTKKAPKSKSSVKAKRVKKDAEVVDIPKEQPIEQPIEENDTKKKSKRSNAGNIGNSGSFTSMMY